MVDVVKKFKELSQAKEEEVQRAQSSQGQCSAQDSGNFEGPPFCFR
jgi:hypothetical protein